MPTLKNGRSVSLLLIFSLIFSVASAQHPFFGKQRGGTKPTNSSRPAFGGRVTSPDSSGFGGPLGIVWERLVKDAFPESQEDGIYHVAKLSDGTFALSGSLIVKGTQSDIDGFVMKVTSEGQVIWKKRLGVRREDFFPAICATPDGGLVATGPFSIDSSAGMPVVKFNSSGDIEWQTKVNNISSWGVDIILSGEGGYIIVGDLRTSIVDSDSCITSVMDRRSVSSVIVNLDSTGQVLWQKSYPIGLAHSLTGDWYKKVVKLPDGYVVMNNTNVIGGLLDTCQFLLLPADLMLMKIDRQGNLIWSKKYGGSRDDFGSDIELLPGSRLLILGYTASRNGDLQGINSIVSNEVAWKLIVNDTGQILNNEVYDLLPGKNSFFYTAVINKDSSCFVTGNAEMVDSANNFFDYNGYLCYFNNSETLQWSTVFPGRGLAAIQSINEKELLYGGLINAFQDGMFGRIGASSNITGSVYYDLNKNNFKDPNEPYANKFLVTSAKPGYSRSSVAQNGWFRNDVDTGTYKTTVTLNNNYYVSVPGEKQTTFTSLFQKDTVHFALQPVAGKRDLSINLIPLTPARPGFNAKYKLTFRNNGTDTIANGAVLLIKDSKTTLVSSLPAAGLVTGDSILWAYAGLKPFDSYSIDIEVKLAAPPTLNNGDTLRYKAIISSTNGGAPAIDLTPMDDTSFVAQVVTGAYDPNDKQENVAGKIPLAKITSGEDIQYVIRFQNTGTDTAFTVRITDTLDTKLNWNSLQMTAASHPYKMKVYNGNKITWIFDNILLPDSNVNEPLSHGYITFRIKAKTNLSAGDYFQNKASIYFDYNLPIVTNTAITVVSNAIVTSVRDADNSDMQIMALPNPTTGNFYLKLSGERIGKFEYSVIDLFGRVLQTGKMERNSRRDTQYIPINLNKAGAGVFYIVVRQKDKVWQQKLIVQ